MPVELQIAFNLIGTTTVVVGCIFATYQFVTFRRQRQQEVALALMRTTAPPEIFSREVRRIFALPDRVGRCDPRARSRARAGGHPGLRELVFSCPDLIEAVARSFGVSQTAAAVRFIELGHIERERQ